MGFPVGDQEYTKTMCILLIISIYPDVNFCFMSYGQKYISPVFSIKIKALRAI
jgi:hypothetical protein